MKQCKHEEQLRELFIPPTRGVTMPMITLRCLDCGAWLPLGPSSDSPPEVRGEMILGGLIADAAAEYVGDAFDECVEIYVDIFADDTPNPNLRKPGPRSPIEIMVDRACGVEHTEES